MGRLAPSPKRRTPSMAVSCTSRSGGPSGGAMPIAGAALSAGATVVGTTVVAIAVIVVVAVRTRALATSQATMVARSARARGGAGCDAIPGTAMPRSGAASGAISPDVWRHAHTRPRRDLVAHLWRHLGNASRHLRRPYPRMERAGLAVLYLCAAATCAACAAYAYERSTGRLRKGGPQTRTEERERDDVVKA